MDCKQTKFNLSKLRHIDVKLDILSCTLYEIRHKNPVIVDKPLCRGKVWLEVRSGLTAHHQALDNTKQALWNHFMLS